jgi:hypothetical protein
VAEQWLQVVLLQLEQQQLLVAGHSPFCLEAQQPQVPELAVGLALDLLRRALLLGFPVGQRQQVLVLGSAQLLVA